MNDFDYDVREKKRIAAGARARKCGSKSKRCTLPSDYLTAKQRKGLNGKMSTYNLSAPMNWTQFREMPEDLQKEYLSKLYADWGVSSTELAKMFGCSSETVRHTCKSFAIKVKTRGGRMNNAQMQHWQDWLKSNGVSTGIEEEGSNQNSACLVDSAHIVSGTIRLQGTSSTLLDTISLVLGTLKNRKLTVEINFDSE